MAILNFGNQSHPVTTTGLKTFQSSSPSTSLISERKLKPLWSPAKPYTIRVPSYPQVCWPLCCFSNQMSQYRRDFPLAAFSLWKILPPDIHTDTIGLHSLSLHLGYFLNKAYSHLKLHTLNLCYCAYRFLWHFQTYYIISILLIVLHQSPSALMSTSWWESCLSLFWLICSCAQRSVWYISGTQLIFAEWIKWNITMILASRLNFRTILLFAILFKAKLSKKFFFNYENMITHLQEIWKIYNSYI